MSARDWSSVRSAAATLATALSFVQLLIIRPRLTSLQWHPAAATVLNSRVAADAAAAAAAGDVGSLITIMTAR